MIISLSFDKSELVSAEALVEPVNLIPVMKEAGRHSIGCSVGDEHTLPGSNIVVAG